MYKQEKELLKSIWEERRETLRDARQAEDTQLSESCYVSFGTYGIAVCKYRQGRWQRKIVNNWRALSFDEFLALYNAAPWEKMR